jgi:hypothetical protein
LGVLDTLSAGFGLINRRLWLIALPVILDLFLWFGPHLSIAPVLQSWLPALNASVTAAYREAAAAEQPASESDRELQAQLNQVIEVLSRGNFLVLIATQVPSLVRDLEYSDLGTVETAGGAPAGREPAFQVTSGLGLVGIGLGLFVISLLLGSLYFQAIAGVVQDDKETRYGLSGFARRALMGWLRLAGYFCLLGLGTLILLIPVLVVTVGLALVSPALAGLLFSVLMMTFVAWLWVFMAFAVPAMFASNVDPLRGIWYSYNVVARNFWVAVRLIAILFVISLGIPLALRLLVQYPAGSVIGFLANAYVASGLFAASVIFYRDRFQTWQASGVRRPHVVHQ